MHWNCAATSQIITRPIIFCLPLLALDGDGAPAVPIPPSGTKTADKRRNGGMANGRYDQTECWSAAEGGAWGGQGRPVDSTLRCESHNQSQICTGTYLLRSSCTADNEQVWSVLSEQTPQHAEGVRWKHVHGTPSLWLSHTHDASRSEFKRGEASKSVPEIAGSARRCFGDVKRSVHNKARWTNERPLVLSQDQKPPGKSDMKRLPHTSAD